MIRFCHYLLTNWLLITLLSFTSWHISASEPDALPLKEIQEFAKVLELIKKNHVTAKSDQELLLAAINGMLASLDNQSRYLNKDELALFTRIATGKQAAKATTRAKILNDDILYIDIDYFHASTANTIEKIWQSYSDQDIKGVILDLRQNPGGFVTSAVAVADLFLEKGLITASRGRVPEASADYNATPPHLDIGAPIVVLVDGQTASAAEIVAAALQDYKRARLVGQKTYGKGSIQSLMKTKFGAIQLTTSYYYSPLGHMIHENGIQPDIELGSKQLATVAEAEQIQYHQQSMNITDWQLNWTIMALQENKF